MRTTVGTTHSYAVTVTWTGNDGPGTSHYRAYRRDHEISGSDKPPIPASSDPAFRGDPARWNPEELFLASVSQCHMLWYLHLATAEGITVIGYTDQPTGIMLEEPDGAGQFTAITLQPHVTIADHHRIAAAERLHDRVPAMCFIARSINVPVSHEPVTTVATSTETAPTRAGAVTGEP